VNTRDASTARTGRKRLLEAAAVLFAQSGYQAVSVAQILELSGLKAPSLYHHFGDKEGLYVEWAVGAISAAGKEIGDQKDVHGVVQALLRDARFDFLQILRDMRDLKDATNLSTVRDTVDERLIKPVAAILQRVSPRGASIDSHEQAYFLLHAAMYAHPAYTSMRKGTKINGSVASWIGQMINDRAAKTAP